MIPSHLDTADTVPRTALVSLVSQLTGANPNPDDDEPHGPGAPVIRRVLDRYLHLVEPGGTFGPEPGLAVALNPQPLPPRLALATALAQEMIDRTALFLDFAAALPDEARGHVHEALGRRLSAFADEYCGNGRVAPWWPLPGPSQGDGAPVSMRSVEQVVMGVEFKRAAASASAEGLQGELAQVGDRLIDAGLARS